MTHENNNLPGRHSNDAEQIDLIDVLVQIWRGKWIIAIFVAISLAAAGTYLMVAKEKWTSIAVISSPDVGQIAGYSNAMSVLTSDGRFNVADIQTRVIGRFNAAFSALSETLRNQEEPDILTIDSAVEGQALPLKVTYEGPTAEEAQKRLAEYIEHIDQQIAKELLDDLDANIKTRSKELIESLATQEKVAQEQKDLRLKQIAQALSVATEAKIQAPQIQQTDNVSQDTMFLLGSTALESMIKNESSRPLVFSDDYYKTRKNLLDIKGIVVDSQNMHGYRYVMKPTLPVRRDAPKTVLTLVLAVLLGVIVGTGVALTRNVLRYRKFDV